MIKTTIKCHQRKGSNSIMHSFVPCKTNLTAFTTPLLLSPFCKYIKMTDVNKRERKPKKKTINNGQSCDTCNIGHTRHNEGKIISYNIYLTLITDNVSA
jgi:hypothetical protein